ncbi:MAG: outer membrane protein assembly factor BamD [Alphaproteobacteria bacterium]|nr:outer membrane protein assembly factor BamD [Alphaproteobacteria bacterium]
MASPVFRVFRSLISAVAAVLLLAACASDAVEDDYVEEPVEKLYNEAVDALEKEDYKEAATRFDEVERQHPYSSWAIKGQVMAAYSLYMANQYDEAVLGLDRFLQLHPSNKDADYAYYLKALCYYEQISDVGRDQMMTQLALKTLNELITRYPDSQYARDAKLKLELTYDHLAGKEMDIGRYYQTRKQYSAAIARFASVVEKYQTTTHTPEALLRLVECYQALGLKEEARRYAAVLGHNFPSSSWYLDAYALLEDPTIRQEAEKPWYKLW